jgi:hypothetical protein
MGLRLRSGFARHYLAVYPPSIISTDPVKNVARSLAM